MVEKMQSEHGKAVGAPHAVNRVAPECRRAQASDFPALQRMLELYQHDISDLYDQDLDELGEYGYDLSRHLEARQFFAYVARVGGRYAGFALVGPAFVTQNEGCWMEQFFVLRKYRRGHVGAALARHVFHDHPGAWEVGQMPGNLPAQAFWRKVIGSISEGRYSESQITEGGWKGVLQRFSLEPSK
jgi:predicted acetyltransferase